VAPSELTQVTDLLALFTGVISTTPVVVSTWPTPLTTPSSEQGVFVVPRVNDVGAPTQRLSHALGGSAARSRNMSVVSPVTAPLAQSSGHRLGGNKSPSSQGAKGKEAMEIDDNDLGHLSYSLEQDDIDDDLPHSTFVSDEHDLQVVDTLVPAPKRKQIRKNKARGHGVSRQGGNHGRHRDRQGTPRSSRTTLD